MVQQFLSGVSLVIQTLTVLLYGSVSRLRMGTRRARSAGGALAVPDSGGARLDGGGGGTSTQSLYRRSPQKSKSFRNIEEQPLKVMIKTALTGAPCLHCSAH